MTIWLWATTTATALLTLAGLAYLSWSVARNFQLRQPTGKHKKGNPMPRPDRYTNTEADAADYEWGCTDHDEDQPSLLDLLADERDDRSRS